MKEEIFLSLRREYALKGFIGKHPSFIHLIEKLEMLADKDVSILLIGETGTGKGCCAEIVHQYGPRYRGPFIPFNCGAGPESLFESQLFGHIKGAFTGAHKDHPGLVEEAHTGILFLDEVNSLDCSLQVKLNHFLETGQFRRLGENRFRKSDIRIVAASLTDLREDVQKGTFRKDLYFRLAEYFVAKEQYSQAYQFVQELKSQLLLEQIKRHQIQIPQDTLSYEILEVNSKIENLYQEYGQINDEERRFQLADEISRLEVRKKELWSDLTIN